MLRRWIIRSLALAIFALCVTAWMGSYFGYIHISYDGKTHSWYVPLVDGELESFDSHYNLSPRHGWDIAFGLHQEKMRFQMQLEYWITPFHRLGFAWQPPTGPYDARRIMIPLWFPTTLSAAILYLLWRKTRPQYNAKGFPVEPAANPTHL
jgi:hypothetical protein